MKNLRVVRKNGFLWSLFEIFMTIMMSGYVVCGFLYLLIAFTSEKFITFKGEKLIVFIIFSALAGAGIEFLVNRDSGTFHRIILDILDEGLRYPTIFPWKFSFIPWDEIDTVIYEPISKAGGWADGDIIIYVSEFAKGKFKTTKVQDQKTKKIIKVKTIIINTKRTVLNGEKIYRTILKKLAKDRRDSIVKKCMQ